MEEGNGSQSNMYTAQLTSGSGHTKIFILLTARMAKTRVLQPRFPFHKNYRKISQLKTD